MNCVVIKICTGYICVCYYFFFLYIKRVLAKGQQKYVKNNNIPPVKRTEGGPVNIRDGQTERKTVTKVYISSLMFILSSLPCLLVVIL